jgi:hypothetical protein
MNYKIDMHTVNFGDDQSNSIRVLGDVRGSWLCDLEQLTQLLCALVSPLRRQFIAVLTL